MCIRSVNASEWKSILVLKWVDDCARRVDGGGGAAKWQCRGAQKRPVAWLSWQYTVVALYSSYRQAATINPFPLHVPGTRLSRYQQHRAISIHQFLSPRKGLQCWPLPSRGVYRAQ